MLILLYLYVIHLKISFKVSLQFKNNSKQLISCNMIEKSIGLWLFMIKHPQVTNSDCSLGDTDEA